MKNSKSIFSSPNGKSYLIPFILVTSLFLLWGFAHGLLDVLNKHFQGTFHMSKALSGLVQFSTYIAYFVMAVPAGMFMKKYGYKWGIILGLFLFALGAFSFIPAAFVHSAVPFLIALFVIACGLCILETAANPYSTVLGPKESSAQRINLSQSFNGLGWVLGPLIGGALIFGADEKDNFALTLPYILVGSVVVVVAVLFLLVKLPDINEESDEEKQEDIVTPGHHRSIWHHKHFVLAVIAQFLYCASQVGIFAFFINYVMELDPHLTKQAASKMLSLGGMASFMIGRLSGSFLMKWAAPNKLLALYAFINATCMALVMLSLDGLSLGALYCSFFFMSIMFPTIFALGLRDMGTETKKASSFIVMGVAGGAFSPMLMGLIGGSNMAIGFVVPFIGFVYILFYGLKGYKL